MCALRAGFHCLATAMLVMVSSRRFCERGEELWHAASAGGLIKSRKEALATLLLDTTSFWSHRQFCSRNLSMQTSQQTWNNSSRWNHRVGSPQTLHGRS